MKGRALEAKYQAAHRKVEDLKGELSHYQKGSHMYNMHRKKILRAMQDRKRIEDSMHTNDAQIGTFSTLAGAHETIRDMKETVETLEQGNRELEAVKQDLDPDKVADLQYDFQENMQNVQEIGRMLQEDMNAGGLTEADLDDELAEFEPDFVESLQATPSAVPSYAHQAPTANATPYNYQPPDPSGP